MSNKPVIFISYSHLDEPVVPEPGEVKWRTYVTSHLQPAVKNGIFDLWVDHDIEGGADWRAAIEEKLNRCDISVLLVSRHALSSDFILDVEVKRMLERRETDKLPVVPIVLSPFATDVAPWLMAMNLRPREGKPLSTFAMADRDTKMAEIASEVAALAREIAKAKVATSKGVTVLAPTAEIKVEAKPPTIISGGKQETKSEETEATLGFVDLTHLPEIAYERLVGREKELKQIDDAWADTNINILSLIAEGGAGKSALVNEWLKIFQSDSYRGAVAVLGWSFYSQGSKERATSAETFLNWALGQLGIKLESTSASAKGEAIAEVLAERRVLLVLDGVEPLQHGPGPQVGQLKDLGLRALLRRVAVSSTASAHGLVVLSSRLAIKDIEKWEKDVAPLINVEQLSEEAGAALLRDNGVLGTDKELRAASRDFGGHPLALGLLASYLKEKHFGDVRRRGNIRAYLADPENPRHDHARRVMESYEKEWLADQPELMAIMYIVGLFDRPASEDCARALRRAPAIKGLTDVIVELSDDDWNSGVHALREVRLLAPPDPAAPNALDAHPLVREWFGERLREKNEAAWREAHGRLYEHLRDTTTEGATPTLDHLAPLYQAIAHGCRAGRQEEAFENIYQRRICRRLSAKELEFYASKRLGALGTDLAAISWFFDQPYATPIASFDLMDRAWLLNLAAAFLRAQGRFAEALPADRVSLRMAEDAKDFRNAAVAACNISQIELLGGQVSISLAMAEKGVGYADRSGDRFWIESSRVVRADALHAAGRRQEAVQGFSDAERRQRDRQHALPLLYGQQGYLYCDALLAERQYAAALEHAANTLELGRGRYSLLAHALDLLTQGRASTGLALSNFRPSSFDSARMSVRQAGANLGEALDGLRRAGHSDHVPRALLSLAVLRRCIGDCEAAAGDLDEVEEIAEPGPMRLYLCDMALERARLAFAQIEAFAPLNGMLEKDNPPKPEVPSLERIAELKDEAAKQIKIADEYIQTCGYHRRDEELAELQAVLRGEKKFAELPPRV